MTGAKLLLSEKLKEIVELLISARADIVVNKNFIASVEAINIVLDEIAVLESQTDTSLHE